MSVEWRRLRADQLRALARQEAVVILPVGSIEQHGPHLPVEVDSVLGEAVALRTAAAMQRRGAAVAVLPMLWTGLSEHHMSFGGTVTLSLPTFLAVVGDICRSVVRHGFRRIVLLNGHGGNETALRAAADDLAPALGVPIVQFTYWYAAAAEIAAILKTQSALLHACEAETAMMMALRPDGLEPDRFPAPSQEPPDPTGPGMHRWRAIGSRSPVGVIGNPRAATAETGTRLLDAISETLAARLCAAGFWEVPFIAEAAKD